MATRFRLPLNSLSAALLAALAAPTPALAQSAAPAASTPTAKPAEQALPEVKVNADADNSFKPDVSTVGGKGQPQLLRDIPQSVTVINRTVMDSQAASSLADVLRNVPGITIGAAEGGTIGNNINLRGFSARTDLYVDGARDRGQYYRDVFSLDSVEVLKGPSSMLFGRGSTGGVINQVTKAPSLKAASEVSATVGTNRSVRSTGDFNVPLSESSAFRVAVMAQDVHSTRDVMQNKDFGMAPAVTVGLGTPTEISLSALVSHNRDMPDYGLPPVNGAAANVNRKNYYGMTDDRTVQDVTEVSAKLKHKINSNWTLRNQTTFNRYAIDVRASGPNSVGTVNGAGVYTALPVSVAGAASANANGNVTSLPLSSLFVQLGSHDRKIDDQGIYNTTDLIGEFDTGSIKHTLTVGLEVGRDSYTNQTLTRTLPVVSLLNPAYTATPGNSVLTTGNYAQASSITVAPYVNDAISLGKQWKVVAGLRYDTFKAGITNSVPSATVPVQASQKNTFTSVRTGVIYQPTEQQSYYASYGTSFNPSLEALTATAGQQNLPPESNKSYEVGAKWDLMNGNLSLSTALFQIEKTNARTQVSTGVYALAGDIRVQGVEFGAAGRITKNWQVFAGYTILDARIVNASALDGTLGKVPANTPHNSASLWTTYNLSRNWETGGGVTYMSNRFASNTDVVSSGTYVRYDAMLAYHQPKYDLRLNLLNLGNRKDNFDALIPSDGGRSVPTISRTLLATVTYRF